MVQESVFLSARILLALMFVISGFETLGGPAAFAGFLGSIGVPMPVAATWVIIALKLVGGAA